MNEITFSQLKYPMNYIINKLVFTIKNIRVTKPDWMSCYSLNIIKFEMNFYGYKLKIEFIVDCILEMCF